MIPKIDLGDVAEGVPDVYDGLTESVQTLGEASVAFFLEVVLERGDMLLQKFLEYQGEGSTNWPSFVARVITENRLKAFFPRGCYLSSLTREMLLPHLWLALSDVVSNELVQIYFGEGEHYEVAREVYCRGCYIGPDCLHFLGPKVKAAAAGAPNSLVTIH